MHFDFKEKLKQLRPRQEQSQLFEDSKKATVKAKQSPPEAAGRNDIFAVIDTFANYCRQLAIHDVENGNSDKSYLAFSRLLDRINEKHLAIDNAREADAYCQLGVAISLYAEAVYEEQKAKAEATKKKELPDG